MSLPFKPSTAASRRDRENAEAAPAKGPSPALRIALFLGVFYLFVWPALALYLLTLAVSGACLLPGVTGCEAFLALDSALPAWAARSLGGLLLLALALSFLVVVGVVLLVIGFGSSGALASAYGVAVTTTMLIDTLLVAAVALLLWRAPLWLALPLLLGFLVVDGLFFAANVPKIFQGGAFPVVAGVALFVLMTTWKRGKQMLFARLDETALPLQAFLDSIRIQPPHRVDGTAIFLSARPDAVPHALLHNLLHNQVLHQQVVLLTVVGEDCPRVEAGQRIEVTRYGDGFFRVLLHFGFMEEPNVPEALRLCRVEGLNVEPMRTTYFLSRETVIPTKRFGMAPWRERLFVVLQKNANSSMSYFHLPVNRVIELGTQVEI